VAASPGVVDGDCLGLLPSQVSNRLHRVDWSFETRDPQSGDEHAMHPYPAKFIPELPRALIQRLSLPGDLIVDPFSGGGTTAVEALRLRRDFYGIDANPVGNLLARAKTAAVGRDDLSLLRNLEAHLMGMQATELESGEPQWEPEIPNCAKWYDPKVFRALALIRDATAEVSLSAARDLAFAAFLQAAAKLSYQESETRYVSRPREIEVLEVPKAVLRELRRVRIQAESRMENAGVTASFIDGDARDPTSFELADGAAGAVITSPPYPNTYDYHLYHRFRLFWLGEQPSALRRIEVGSHLKNQSLADPIAAYLSDIEAVLRGCFRVLQRGRFAVFVVGDGKFDGKVFATAPALAQLAVGHEFEHVATVDRRLPINRRSITKPGRRLTVEQILVLRKPEAPRSAIAVPPNYKLAGYEMTLRVRELAALGGSPAVSSEGEVEVTPQLALDRAAFTHEVRAPATTRLTAQRRAEIEVDPTGRRKNSTYGPHGVHRYKGKFYPQLAKSLLNLSGLEPGRSLACDPFGGSGTVATEAIAMGIDVVSLDCNPVAAATSRAKVSLVGPHGSRIAAEVGELRKTAEHAPAHPRRLRGEFAASVEAELESWFPAPVLDKLSWLLGEIRSEEQSPEARLVGEVIASDLVRDISQQEPRDLRIRRRRQPLSDAPVFSLFVERAQRLEEKLRAYHSAQDGQATGTARILQIDSADPAAFDCLGDREIEAVVSSPPYATALPYIDTDRLSLAAIFGYGVSSRRGLERTMIGSREVNKREMTALETELDRGGHGLPHSTIEFLTRFAAAVRADDEAGFRRRQSPAVLFRYFQSMRDVLANVASRMSRGAPCWLVLGDSRSTIGGEKWVIPTVDEVGSIGVHLGFEIVDRLPISVSREDLVHARNSITRNEILELRLSGRAES
jgi:DNA modification methylase